MIDYIRQSLFGYLSKILQRGVVYMTENIRCESNSNKKENFVECRKLNCRKLVYKKKLPGRFKLYLSDKKAYQKAFDLLAKKIYIHH